MNKLSGHAVYTGFVLKLYDLIVCEFSNRFVWHCASHRIQSLYDRRVSANHLEVGPGTGYFLDRCAFSSGCSRLVLLDLNLNCLEKSMRRLARYSPQCRRADIRQKPVGERPGFDSIGLNYVLHCLPGNAAAKETVMENLKTYLNPGGVVFGSTILGRGGRPGVLARMFIKVYNSMGIFSNVEDSPDLLRQILEKHFKTPSLEVRGNVALFMARR